MNTEFAVFIIKTINTTPDDIKLKAQLQNGVLLKLIGIELILGDEKCKFPQLTFTWQFNFKFNL
jgi:hypothetical protein